MLTSSVFRNSITSISIISSTKTKPKSSKSNSLNNFSFQFRIRANLQQQQQPLLHQSSNTAEFDEREKSKPRVLLNSIRVLEWDKVCDAVSSFAGTSLGRLASKEQLCSFDQTYEESLMLLRQTNAAVEIHKYNNAIMDFTGLDVFLVRSAIDHARRGTPVVGQEAMAVAVLLQFAEALQTNIKGAIKENADMLDRFMPLAELILDWVTNKSLVKSILQVIDEDGYIKDTASGRLKQARWRVSDLENKLHHLMNTLIANETNSLEASNVDGRWCIKSGAGQITSFKGLLLSSGAGRGNIIEPVSAVQLNDELLGAKASVADAETEVLLDLTEKIKLDLDDIEKMLKSVIALDVVNARASYSLSLGGSYPELLVLDDKNTPLSTEDLRLENSVKTKKQWRLCLPKAYHPLLLQRHRHNLREAKKDVANAIAEIRRRKVYGNNFGRQEVTQVDIKILQEKVTQLEEAHPVPADIMIAKNTRVLLITGPNTGGKTICLKAVGLAAMMAKAGLYVVCAEPARIPWFDSVFADIGDEQSLSQSLSTFSGHLRQISIGAGTNPLEGAALGMSILESFAEAGALLTIATTHHGELKTLKYSNDAFENACMEFDDVNLKPTYKILWGVPGRSNAINIAERLGLPNTVINNARGLYGTASAEIDEVIYDLEKFKLDVEEYIDEAQHYLRLSRDLHEKVQDVQRKLDEHSSDSRYRLMQQILDFASMARSALHKKMRQSRASARKSPHPEEANTHPPITPANSQHSATGANRLTLENGSASSVEEVKASTSAAVIEGPERKSILPKVGDTVQVSSLGTKATVLNVEPSKKEILVQAGKLKLKLKVSAIKF
ncbi:uncharacterized protein LOC104888114 isoform X3 [Beta vulgaris subsp. vulgaris]|uniref:uncharacterized protein LOC104888114 isoform X3 n=1 Tax=Beta vulgaris subsp. vulgaris TaxID=3555 RepID=UPI0020371995|nr:uncharacterized protein LOC104888114 isoform X3 [Beta vulgaris subsp. vulgaris]